MACSLATKGSSAFFSLCRISVAPSKVAIGSSRLSVPWSTMSKHFFSRSSPVFQRPDDAKSPGDIAEEEESEVSPELPRMRAGASPAVTSTQDVSNLQRLEKCVNYVQLMGRVGSEPQLRGTEQHPVLLFSLATHTQYRDETGNMQQKTFWHRVAIFKSGLRETCFKYCRKGHRVFVTGEIQYNNVQDPETNNVRTVTSIVANDLLMLGSSSGSS